MFPRHFDQVKVKPGSKIKQSIYRYVIVFRENPNLLTYI